MRALNQNIRAEPKLSRKEKKAVEKEQKALAKALSAEEAALHEEQEAQRKLVLADLFEPWIEAGHDSKSVDASDLSDFVALWQKLTPVERREFEKALRAGMREGGRDDVKPLRAWRNATAEHCLKLLAGETVPLTGKAIDEGLAALESRLAELKAEREPLEPRQSFLQPAEQARLDANRKETASLQNERAELTDFKAKLEKLPRTGPFQDTRFNLEVSVMGGFVVDGQVTLLGLDVTPPQTTEGRGLPEPGSDAAKRQIEPFVAGKVRLVAPSVKGVLGTKHRGVEVGMSLPLVKVSKNNPIQGDTARLQFPLVGLAASNTGLLGGSIEAPIPLIPLPAFLAFPIVRLGVAVMVSDPRLAKVSEKAADLIEKINRGISRVGHAVASGVKKIIPGGEGSKKAPPQKETVDWTASLDQLNETADQLFEVAKEHAPEYEQLREEAWKIIPGQGEASGREERLAAFNARLEQLQTAQLTVDPDRKPGGTSPKTPVLMDTGKKKPETSNFKHDLAAFYAQDATTQVMLALDLPALPVAARLLEGDVEGEAYAGWLKDNIKGDDPLPASPQEWTRDQVRETMVVQVLNKLFETYDFKNDNIDSKDGHAVPTDLDQALRDYQKHGPTSLDRFKVGARHSLLALPSMPPAQDALYRDYVHGKIDLDDSDFAAIFDAIARLQALPESEFRACVQGMVDFAFKDGKTVGQYQTPDDMMNALLLARDSLHLPFAQLVTDLKAERAARDNGTLPLLKRVVTFGKDTKLRVLDKYSNSKVMEFINRVTQHLSKKPQPVPLAEAEAQLSATGA